MDVLTLLAVFLLAFATMFIGALSGGVGLVMRPLLILFGYSPQIVVGTSRASAIFGELPGVIVLQKKRKADQKTTFLLTIPIMVGTILAALFTIAAEARSLRIIIGVIVLVMAVFLLVKRKFGEVEVKPKFSKAVRTALAIMGSLIVAFLNTITGGLGLLYSALYAWLYGKTYIGAASMWRVAAYIGGFVGSVIFIVRGIIDWRLFVALSLGFMLGSYFGTHFGLKKGEKWAKYIVIIVAVASAIKLLAS